MTEHDPPKRQHSEETKQKIGNSRRGKKMPKAAVEAMTARVRANPPRPMKGRKHSPESIEKMRQARLNRVLDPVKEARRIEAVKAASIGRKHTREAKDKIRESVLKQIQDGRCNFKYRDTAGERLVASFLEERGIEFQAQFLLEGHLYDFFLPNFNLIIEVDGAHHWETPWFEPDETKHASIMAKRKQKDLRQTLVAESSGYQVVRIRCKNAPGDSHHGTLEKQLENAGISLELRKESN